MSVGRQTLHVLVINKGPRRASVDLRAPAAGVASVQRLSAPAPSARSGVTLAGQSLDEDGRWRGQPVVGSITPEAGHVGLGVPRYSAALVSVQVAARALG